MNKGQKIVLAVLSFILAGLLLSGIIIDLLTHYENWIFEKRIVLYSFASPFRDVRLYLSVILIGLGFFIVKGIKHEKTPPGV